MSNAEKIAYFTCDTSPKVTTPGEASKATTNGQSTEHMAMGMWTVGISGR